MAGKQKHMVLLEPFYSGSHKKWALGFAEHSEFRVTILSLPGRHWKWRMHGGALSLAKQFNAINEPIELIVGTSMLDFSTFLGLTRHKSAGIPTAMYFHENQLTYPWSPQDRDVKNKRDNHYAFINYSSALVADRVFFNSEYHRTSFLDALPGFLNQFPDKRDKSNIDLIKKKSEVLHLGLDLSRFDAYKTTHDFDSPLIVWNHRWEYDKRPKPFFSALKKISEKGIDFKLAVLGERNEMIPKSFDEARITLDTHIVQWGFAETFKEYAEWLWKADVLPVTSKQDFFGGSVVEAMYCECLPLLPNRLAYPGHLSKEAKKTFLYEEGDFERSLEEMLINWESIPYPNPQQLVAGYDWETMITQYDDEFASVCETN